MRSPVFPLSIFSHTFGCQGQESWLNLGLNRGSVGSTGLTQGSLAALLHDGPGPRAQTWFSPPDCRLPGLVDLCPLLVPQESLYFQTLPRGRQEPAVWTQGPFMGADVRVAVQR